MCYKERFSLFVLALMRSEVTIYSKSPMLMFHDLLMADTVYALSLRENNLITLIY